MGGKSVGSKSVLRDTQDVSQGMVLPEIKAEIPKLGEELKNKFNDRLEKELTWYSDQVSRLAAKERRETDHGELKPNLDFKSLAAESTGMLQVLASRTETVWQERIEGLRKEFPTFLLDERRIAELVDGARKEGLRDEYLKYAKEKGLSQDEKVRELTKIPEFALREGELRHHLFSDELKETTNRLLEVSYEIGVYTSLSTQGDLESVAKHRSLQTERSTLRETLTRLMSEIPEDYPNRDKIVAGASQINAELGKLELAGMQKFRELSREKQQESLAEYNQKRKEGGALFAVKEIFDKAGDGKEHLMEWCSLLTIGSVFNLYGRITEGTYDMGAKYIQDQRERLNSSTKAGSMWGSDAEFSKVGDISVVVGVSPLGALRHVSDAVLQPGLELVNVGRIEAQRRAGSLGALAGEAYYGAEDSTGALSYTEYQEAEQSDGMLKTAKKSFEVAEIAASLALGKADTAGKLAGQMVMSGGMGAGSALSAQLMEMDDPNKKFDIARFVDESISNTAGSAVFSSGMRVFRGNNKVLNTVGEVVDKVDGWADFGSSLGNFDNVKGEYSKAGALLGLAVATTDVSDIKIGDKIGEKVDGFLVNRTLRQAQGRDPSTGSGQGPFDRLRAGGSESEFEFKDSQKTVNTLSRVNVATENLIVDGREYEVYRSGNGEVVYVHKNQIPELYSSILKSRGEVDPNGSYDVTSFIDKKSGLIFSQMPAPNESEEITESRVANLAHEDEHREDLEAGREIDEERAYARASKYTDNETLTTYDESRYQDAKNLSLAASRESEGVEYNEEKSALLSLISKKKGIVYAVYENIANLKKQLGDVAVEEILSDTEVRQALDEGNFTGLMPQPDKVESLREKLRTELKSLEEEVKNERQGNKHYGKFEERSELLVDLVKDYLDACGIAYRISYTTSDISEGFLTIRILAVPGVSVLNDQALIYLKKYDVATVYSPMYNLIQQVYGSCSSYRGTIQLSHESVISGVFTKDTEGHEAEHAAFDSLEKAGYQSSFLGSLELHGTDLMQEDSYSKIFAYHEIPAFSKTVLELAKDGKIDEVDQTLNTLRKILDRLMKGNSAIAVAVYNGTKIRFFVEEVKSWDQRSKSYISTQLVKCMMGNQNYTIRLTLGEARDINKLALQYGYEDREQFISHIAFMRLHEMSKFGYPLLEYINNIRYQISISKDAEDDLRWLVPELENLRRIILDQASISIEETYVNYVNNSGASGDSTPLSEIIPSSAQDRISGQENRSRDVSSFAVAFSGLNVAPTHLNPKSSPINYLPTREAFEDEFVLQERRSAEAKREVFNEAQSRIRARETYAFFSRLNEQVYSLVPETLQEREAGEKGPERRTRIMQAMAVMHELMHKELEASKPVKNSRMAMRQEIEVWKRCALYLKARGYEYRFPKEGGWTIVEVLSESEANRLSAERRKIEKARNLPAGSELRLSKVEKQAIRNFVRRAYGAVKPRLGVEGDNNVLRQGAYGLAGMLGPDGSLIGRLSNRRDNPNLARDVLDHPNKYKLDDNLLISMVELGYYKEVVSAFSEGKLDGLKGERRGDLVLAILFEIEEDGVLANLQEFLKLISSFQNFKLLSGEEVSRVVLELLRLNGALTILYLGDLGIDFRSKSESTVRILEAAARGNPIELKNNFGRLRLDIEKDASLVDRIVGQSIRSKPICLENLALYGFRSNRNDHLDRIANICSSQIKEVNSSVLKYFYETSALSDPLLLRVRDRAISQVLDDNPFLIFASKRLFGKIDVGKSLTSLNTILLPIHKIGSKEKVNDEDYRKLLGSFFLNKILSTDISSQERINILNQTILSNPKEILELCRILSPEQLQSLKAFAKSNKLWSIQLVLDMEGIRAPSNHLDNDFWGNSMGPLMQQAIDSGDIKLDDPRFEGYLSGYFNDFDLAYSPELLRVYLRICSCQQDMLDRIVDEIPGAKEFISENSGKINKKSLISYLKFLKRNMLSEAIQAKHQGFDSPLLSSIWDNIVGRLYTQLKSENPKTRLIKDSPLEISKLVRTNLLSKNNPPKMLSRERIVRVPLKGNRDLAKLSNGTFEGRKDVQAGINALVAIVLDSQVNTLNAFTREGVFTYLNDIDPERKKMILESIKDFSGRSSEQSPYKIIPLLYILTELFENATNHAVANKNSVELRAMEPTINVLRRLKTEYEALSDEADITKALPLAMVPDIGMLRAFSPDISRTCAYDMHKELANAKNITAFMFVEQRNTPFEDVVGSVWAVDTQTDPNGPDPGKRVLLIRANNPRMELFGRYDAESLVEAIIDEMIEVAKEENFDYVVLPKDYTWRYSATNSDKVRNYCLKKYGHCPFLALDPNDPSVKFNGVDNADVNGPNPVVVIWSRSQEVEKIKNTFNAAQTDLLFDSEMNADSEVRDLVERAAQAIKDYDGISREWNRAKADPDYRNGSPQFLERAYQDVNRDLLQLLAPIENLQKELKKRKGVRKIADKPVLDTSNIRVRKGKSIEKNDNDARDGELNQIGEFSSFGISRGSADEVVATLAHANHNLIPHQQLLIDQFKLLNSKGQAVKLFASSGYQKEVGDECTLVTTNKAPSAADMILYFEKISSDGILIPCSPDIKIIQINFLGAKGGIVEGSTNLTRSIDGSYLLRGLPDGCDKLAVSYVKVEKPSFKEIYRELERMPVHDAVINASILDVIERLPSTDTEYERAQKIAKLFCNQGLVYSLDSKLADILDVIPESNKISLLNGLNCGSCDTFSMQLQNLFSQAGIRSVVESGPICKVGSGRFTYPGHARVRVFLEDGRSFVIDPTIHATRNQKLDLNELDVSALIGNVESLDEVAAFEMGVKIRTKYVVARSTGTGSSGDSVFSNGSEYSGGHSLKDDMDENVIGPLKVYTELEVQEIVENYMRFVEDNANNQKRVTANPVKESEIIKFRQLVYDCREGVSIEIRDYVDKSVKYLLELLDRNYSSNSGVDFINNDDFTTGDDLEHFVHQLGMISHAEGIARLMTCLSPMGLNLVIGGEKIETCMITCQSVKKDEKLNPLAIDYVKRIIATSRMEDMITSAEELVPYLLNLADAVTDKEVASEVRRLTREFARSNNLQIGDLLFERNDHSEYLFVNNRDSTGATELYSDAIAYGQTDIVKVGPVYAEKILETVFGLVPNPENSEAGEGAILKIRDESIARCNCMTLSALLTQARCIKHLAQKYAPESEVAQDAAGMVFAKILKNRLSDGRFPYDLTDPVQYLETFLLDELDGEEIVIAIDEGILDIGKFNISSIWAQKTNGPAETEQDKKQRAERVLTALEQQISCADYKSEKEKWSLSPIHTDDQILLAVLSRANEGAFVGGILEDYVRLVGRSKSKLNLKYVSAVNEIVNLVSEEKRIAFRDNLKATINYLSVRSVADRIIKSYRLEGTTESIEALGLSLVAKVSSLGIGSQSSVLVVNEIDKLCSDQSVGTIFGKEFDFKAWLQVEYPFYEKLNLGKQAEFRYALYRAVFDFLSSTEGQEYLKNEKFNLTPPTVVGPTTWDSSSDFTRAFSYNQFMAEVNKSARAGYISDADIKKEFSDSKFAHLSKFRSLKGKGAKASPFIVEGRTSSQVSLSRSDDYGILADYQKGDTIKSIDWRASAGKQTLKVRTFHQPNQNQESNHYEILVDGRVLSNQDESVNFANIRNLHANILALRANNKDVSVTIFLGEGVLLEIGNEEIEKSYIQRQASVDGVQGADILKNLVAYSRMLKNINTNSNAIKGTKQILFNEPGNFIKSNPQLNSNYSKGKKRRSDDSRAFIVFADEFSSQVTVDWLATNPNIRPNDKVYFSVLFPEYQYEEASRFNLNP